MHSLGENEIPPELSLPRPSCHPPASPRCSFLFPQQVFHEQGILFGYRHPQSSATACVLSLFQMTNETLNIWTHLLPFWYLPAPSTGHVIQEPWGLGLLQNPEGLGRLRVRAGILGTPTWGMSLELGDVGA